jgi:proline-specific peptidase
VHGLPNVAAVNDLHGYIPFAGGDTWYRLVGDVGAGAPLVLLHGGPGFPSYYLENLMQLASPEHPVIVYDQVSCGRSTGPADPPAWTFDVFIEQFKAVLAHLGVEKVDLLGHSWGGFLGLEIALRHPELLRRLILASTSPGSQMFVDAAMQRVATMAPDAIDAIEKGEATGDYATDEFQKANCSFLKQFCDRMDPIPPAIQKSKEAMNADMYVHMWGPTEFRCTGTLGDWDVSTRLGEIVMPVLITSGGFDEAGPAIQEFMLSKLPDSRWKCFEQSAHHSHQSEEAEFVATVGAFLD